MKKLNYTKYNIHTVTYLTSPGIMTSEKPSFLVTHTFLSSRGFSLVACSNSPCTTFTLTTKPAKKHLWSYLIFGFYFCWCIKLNLLDPGDKIIMSWKNLAVTHSKQKDTSWDIAVEWWLTGTSRNEWLKFLRYDQNQWAFTKGFLHYFHQ